MAFRTCTVLCTITSIWSRTFHHSKCDSSHSPLFLPQTLAFASLLSVFMDLLLLDISFKQNHKLCGLLYLTSFTQDKVSKESRLRNIRCVDVNILFIHPSVHGYLGCFYLLAIVTNAVMKCTSTCLNTCFLFFWVTI